MTTNAPDPRRAGYDALMHALGDYGDFAALFRAVRRSLGGTVSYNVYLAKVGGGATAGLFLANICYWCERSTDPEGWVWKTREQLGQETALTRREQETARRDLVATGVLQEQLRGLPARLYYRVDWRVLAEKIAAVSQVEWPPVREPEEVAEPLVEEAR